MNIRKRSPVILLSLLLFCNSDNPSSVPNNRSVFPFPQITIQSSYSLMWFRDSLFQEFIYPSVYHCTQESPCIYSLNYTCTVLPDTLWGILHRMDDGSNETLFCYSDFAYVKNDTIVYDMQTYLSGLFNAICSPEAINYTSKGISYQCMSWVGEDSVRVFNSCFDTTFRGLNSFSLPKLPLDSTNRINFVSVDTFSCSVIGLNMFSGILTMQIIKNLPSEF